MALNLTQVAAYYCCQHWARPTRGFGIHDTQDSLHALYICTPPMLAKDPHEPQTRNTSSCGKSSLLHIQTGLQNTPQIQLFASKPARKGANNYPTICRIYVCNSSGKKEKKPIVHLIPFTAYSTTSFVPRYIVIYDPHASDRFSIEFHRGVVCGLFRCCVADW